MNNKIEIIGITTCGTYPSWVDYTVASFYNHVNRVVVINAGYDIQHPEKGALLRLEREHLLLQEKDIDHIIIEITPTQSDVDYIFKTLCKDGKDEYGRTSNITFSTKIA